MNLKRGNIWKRNKETDIPHNQTTVKGLILELQTCNSETLCIEQFDYNQTALCKAIYVCATHAVLHQFNKKWYSQLSSHHELLPEARGEEDAVPLYKELLENTEIELLVHSTYNWKIYLGCRAS